MSNPKGIKNLWKNIDWINKEEKLAFYNKYFKGKEFVNKDIEKGIEDYKNDILRFIETNEIREKGKVRPLEINDIEKYIKEG